MKRQKLGQLGERNWGNEEREIGGNKRERN